MVLQNPAQKSASYIRSIITVMYSVQARFGTSFKKNSKTLKRIVLLLPGTLILVLQAICNLIWIRLPVSIICATFRKPI